MKRTNLILISALFSSGLFVNAHAGVIDRATMLSNTCAGCHGPNGISNGPLTPSIAGLSKEFISISMHDFASGKRPSTVMQRIAKGYSDADIKALSEYFSKLPSKAAEAKASDKHHGHNH
jgi:sulfide dehydrogenase cytochrome subunit